MDSGSTEFSERSSCDTSGIYITCSKDYVDADAGRMMAVDWCLGETLKKGEYDVINMRSVNGHVFCQKMRVGGEVRWHS